MQERSQARGSATRWGPLFSAGAADWAETWEGPFGWGTPVYTHVLDRENVGQGTRLLDCGCGAGRFARLAADCGANVAGIDASEAMIAIATSKTPAGDFRVGDMEQLPWPDRAFDLVTGFSTFQFADNKVRALTEAKRVTQGHVTVVVPSRAADSGIATVFQPTFPLFPPEALASLRQSGIFALSQSGQLEEVLAGAGLTIEEDLEFDCSPVFSNVDEAVRAFTGAGPMILAIRHSGQEAVIETLRATLTRFAAPSGQILVPSWVRLIVTGA
ncbi:MAG: class I SAM-dependent methyltransferase [Thermomicrobiales bacterium]